MTSITQGQTNIMRVTPQPAQQQQVPAAVGPHPMFRALRIAASGLSAQRARLEVAAQNIANAETTRTPEGGPYRRKSVMLEALAATPAVINPDIADASKSGVSTDPAVTPDDADLGGVRIAGIVEDVTPGPMVYDPGHPDADGNGYVRMPNVRITDEMMEMMDARRVYDANATVFQAAKSMLRRAIDI